MRPFVILTAVFAALLLASFAAACPPVAVSSYGVQVQSHCFAPTVAVQSYAVPQAVVVQQAYPVAVQAFAVKSYAAAGSVNVQVNSRPRVFGRTRVRVNVR